MHCRSAAYSPKLVWFRISLDPCAITQVRHHMDPVGGEREVAGLATRRPTP